MTPPSPPQPIAITDHLRFWAAVALAIAVVAALWLTGGSPAESGQVDAGMESVFTLQAPVHFAVSPQYEDRTAFPEGDAGFSAYYRVSEQSGAQPRPRLDVATVTGALLDNPGEIDGVRARAGILRSVGSNFAIVELPMHAAVLGSHDALPPRNVTVYYDDRGWIVAYLPKDAPAAAIWQYDSKSPANLEPNLLARAIDEVLKAAGLSPVSSPDGYYHWQYRDYNAFVLFSNQSSGGTSGPVNFVIPPKIGDVRASAAVLITSRYSHGDAVSASVSIGEQSVATANETNLLGVSGFDLARPTGETSLHQMTVTVSGGDTAAGVVMLLYKRPAS